MIKQILILGSFFAAGILFMYLRGKIFDKVKDTTKETFNLKKFRAGLFRLGDGVSWAKDLVQMFNVRRLVIYGLIISCIFAYGWYQGKQGKPVHFNLDYEKEFQLKLDSHYLHKPKDSHNLEVMDAKGEKIKTIKVKDLPALQKKLRPIGFELVPIGVIGYGAGYNTRGFEGGVGVSFLRYWQWRVESFLSNKGIYLGTSYKLTDNSNIGVGAGKGYQGDNRILFYYRWRF